MFMLLAKTSNTCELSVTCVYRYQFLILECVSLLVLEYLCNDAVSFSAKMEFTIVSNCSRTYGTLNNGLVKCAGKLNFN